MLSIFTHGFCYGWASNYPEFLFPAPRRLGRAASYCTVRLAVALWLIAPEVPDVLHSDPRFSELLRRAGVAR